MVRSTKSILEEITSFVPSSKREKVLKNSSSHVIHAAINIFELIEEIYSEEEAEKLKSKFILAIKTKNPEKFLKKLK